jgi:hypothetical protein
MAKTARTAPSEALSSEEVLKELHGDHGRITAARIVELLQMLPPTGVTQSSADIIRELRGPLPDDE